MKTPAPGTNGPLLLPCLQAEMGDWTYYVGVMNFKQVAARISLAEDLFTYKALKDRLQRDVTDRAEDIADYLLRQPQRFFNAIIVGACQGNPEWHPIDVEDNPLVKKQELAGAVSGSVGYL